MEDAAPGLYASLKKEYERNIEANRRIGTLEGKLEDGGTYQVAEEYSYEIGEALSKAFADGLSSEVLPDGHMYYNIAVRTVDPLIREAWGEAAAAAVKAQENINGTAGLRIRAKQAEFNEDRLHQLINVLTQDGVPYDEVSGILEGKTTNVIQSAVDDTLKTNADFQARAGLSPKIVRIADPKCCEWCQSLDGEYAYPAPKEIYQRHANCECVVDFHAANGRVQNIHTREWREEQRAAEVEERKRLEQERIEAAAEKKHTGLVYPQENGTINYRVVTTREEAYESLREVFGSINPNVQAIDEGLLCDNVTRLNELNARFGVLPKGNTGEFSASPSEDNPKAIAWTSGAYRRDGNRTNLSLVGRAYGDTEDFEARTIRDRRLFHLMPFSDEYIRTYTITHEYGHMLEQYVCRQRTNWNEIERRIAEVHRDNMSALEQNEKEYEIRKGEEARLAAVIHDEIINIAKKNNRNFNEADCRSDYGYRDDYEFFAEAFANSQCGSPNELGIAINEWLRREGF